MNEQQKLLPCPFCGGPAKYYESQDTVCCTKFHDDVWHNCRTMTKGFNGESALVIWNRRPYLLEIDQLRQRLAEVEDAANDSAEALHEAVQNARRHAGKAEAYSAENDELRAKLAQAEQDARRWRYVRAENAKGMHGAFAIHEAGDNDWFYTTHHDLDQLIDAAIASQWEGK